MGIENKIKITNERHPLDVVRGRLQINGNEDLLGEKPGTIGRLFPVYRRRTNNPPGRNKSGWG